MRRLLTVVITTLIMLAAAAIPAHGSGSTVFSYGFENEDDADKWEGGFFDDSEAASGKMDYRVNDPGGDIIGGRSSHYFSYLQSVNLESGTIYKISMSARNPVFDPSSPQKAGIRRADEMRQIVFEFSGIPERWTTISQYFMVQESDYYSFSVELMDGDVDEGFMVDDLVIERIDINPESLTILGDLTITIPQHGSATSSYRLGAYSQDGETINILSDISQMKAVDLPVGVTFDSDTNTVTVRDYCPNDSTFTLECTAPDFLSLSPITAEVTLTRNIFRNSDFSDGSNRWLFEPAGDVLYGSAGNYLTLFTEIPGDYGYRATLWPDTQALLIEDVMYVLRAVVRVDGDYSTSVYSGNPVTLGENEVTFNLLNMPIGEWVEVVAAFTPEDSGIYNIAVNFFTPSASVIDIDEIMLTPEEPEQTYITLHAPGNISIPEAGTVLFPFSAYVRDQAGDITDGDCELILSPDTRGVSIDSDGISVSSSAEEGEYEIYAEANDDTLIHSSLTFTVSRSNVGDGGFEEKRINEWWAAAQPATMTIVDEGGNKFGRIRSSDEFAIVLNNSYMKLYANQPYVFSARALDGFDHTVTAFIETVGGDRVPIIQSSAESGDIFALFQTEEDIVGRLMLYIASDGSRVRMDIDDIDIFRAVVTAGKPELSGVVDVGLTVEVSFDFYNNLDPDADPTDCTVSWFAVNSAGEEVYLGSGSPFVVPEEAADSYLCCEVTPICKLTGLSGTPVKSDLVPVGGEYENTSPPPLIENEEPENSVISAEPTLTPARLGDPEGSVFEDVANDPAAADIMSLYSAGIVTGVDETHFAPSATLTRGELAEILCKAFSSNGGSQSFLDVPHGSENEKYVAAMYALEIMRGIGDNTFAPEAPVTREQLVTVLSRIYSRLGLDVPRRSVTWFYDYKEISSWAVDGVEIALGLGFLNGTSASTMVPAENITRAEACTMLVKLLTIVEEQTK